MALEEALKFGVAGILDGPFAGGIAASAAGTGAGGDGGHAPAVTVSLTVPPVAARIASTKSKSVFTAIASPSSSNHESEATCLRKVAAIVA